MKPDKFHYDSKTASWDNDPKGGTGVYYEHDGWHYTSFIMGSLQGFGPVPTEEEARRKHKDDMDWGWTIYASERLRDIKASEGIPVEDLWNWYARENGRKLAEVWLAQQTGTIDLWGVDWVSPAMCHAFLARVKETDVSLLNKAEDIEWYFPCETCNDGPPLRDQWKEWTDNFMKGTT